MESTGMTVGEIRGEGITGPNDWVMLESLGPLFPAGPPTVLWCLARQQSSAGKFLGHSSSSGMFLHYFSVLAKILIRNGSL